MIFSLYAAQTPVDERRQQCRRMLVKYPTLLPIVLESVGASPCVHFIALPPSATVEDLHDVVDRLHDRHDTLPRREGGSSPGSGNGSSHPGSSSSSSRSPPSSSSSSPSSSTRSDANRSPADSSAIRRRCYSLVVQDATPSRSTAIGDLFKFCQSEDGFLYVNYTNERRMGFLSLPPTCLTPSGGSFRGIKNAEANTTRNGAKESRCSGQQTRLTAVKTMTTREPIGKENLAADDTLDNDEEEEEAAAGRHALFPRGGAAVAPPLFS